jgi:acetyl esterase/lipase
MIRIYLLFFIAFGFVISLQAQETIYLWPDEVPLATKSKADPVISDNDKRGVTRITEVTNPLLKVYQPVESKANGAGIIICPGGGYSILAINLEGYEVGQWFSNLGFTTFVLQYRVPQQQEAALADVQRAIRMVRYQADRWNLHPTRIGVMGFSAGGSLSARAATLFEQTTYSVVDAMDSVSARPDFAMLIYPAYLDKGENNTLTPELKVSSSTPPMFMFVAADDGHANSTLVMAAALREAKVPVEAHLYPIGGHGYGMRHGNQAAVTWPVLAKKWLEDFVIIVNE